MSDQDRISPYNINTYQANNWWEKKKYQLGNYQLIQNQILWTNFVRTVDTVRRITNKILEVKRLDYWKIR